MKFQFDCSIKTVCKERLKCNEYFLLNKIMWFT